MKITEVKAFYPDYQPARSGWRRHFWQFGVEIHTDSGLVGIGAGGGGQAALPVVQYALRERLIGRDPLEVEALWEEMYWDTIAYGRKGIAIMAISAVDIALWDLIGKQRQQPVFRCLADHPAERVPAYATGNDVAANKVQGFRAFKITAVAGPADGPTGIQRNIEHVARAREAAGESADLMLDCWMRWDLDYTLEMAERLAPYRLKWIEEPLRPDDYAGYSRLTAEVSTTQIAAGEHEFTRYGFQELIERRAVHVLQPDVTWCGGITEAHRICQMAAAQNLPVILHRGGEVWGLHLTLAAGCPMAELVIQASQLPTDPGVVGGPVLDEGHLTLTDQPGLGVTWHPDVAPRKGC